MVAPQSIKRKGCDVLKAQATRRNICRRTAWILVVAPFAVGVLLGASICATGVLQEVAPIKAASVAEVHILRELILEDDNEAEHIEAALIEQGYLRPDVPLDYDLQDILQTACETAGVPYAVALGLIEVESNFKTDVVSQSGCYGLMQLNPDFFQVDLPPAKNIVVGIEHLGELLASYGDAGAAFTAYNAGHDTGHRGYANRVMAAAEKWA